MQELADVLARIEKIEAENADLSRDVKQLKAALASTAAIYRALGEHYPAAITGPLAAALGSVVSIYETFSSSASDGHAPELAGRSDGRDGSS